MSRCFPFPPRGYVLSGIRDEAMIESIKGVEDLTLKAKKELKRKERKREKKEKKEKKRERKEGDSEKRSHKRRRKDKEEGAKDGPNQKVDDFLKLKQSEIDSLEKSSLTVERELLQSTSQNSSDSTLNSNEKPKQKEKQQSPLDDRHKNTLNSNELPKQQPSLHGRHNNTLSSNELPKPKEPLDGRHNNDSESIIRIRLPIRRQKDPEAMKMITNKDEQKPCPHREIKLDPAMVVVTNKDQQKPCPPRELKLDTSQQVNQHPCPTSAPEQATKPREEKRKHHSSRKKSSKEKISSSTALETYQPLSLCKICPPSMAEQFLNVVENWVPNPIERRVETTYSEDEECWWLMKKPSSHKFGTEKCKQVNINNESKQVISSWPCARLLPEADVYALPYTVPF